MSRRPHFIALLLLSMLLQSLSLGGRWAGIGTVEEAMHTLLHWAGRAHHQHAPPQPMPGYGVSASEPVSLGQDLALAFHVDESSESRQHMGLDACLGGMGPIPTPPGVPAAPVGTLPAVLLAETAPAGPYLEGLRRPPRRLS